MIIHELGHMLGLWHEHARYDRDSHVIVLWTNIPAAYRHNFVKQPNTRLISPYDLSSMMHYNLKVRGRAYCRLVIIIFSSDYPR